MDDHKLRVFCTVAETKSFSKASSIIHLTQPAVSLQVQALEEIYESKLFDRSNNTVTLTPAGRVLYKYAKEILTLYASAERDIGSLTGLVKGSLSVGASSTIANYMLPAIIADFRKIHPKTRVNLLVGNSKRVVELLNSGNVDLGLVEGDVTRQKILIDQLIEDELMVVIPSNHAWVHQDTVTLSELSQEPFILREEGSGTRQMVEKHLAKHGLSPQSMNVALILGSTEAIKSAVEQGMGVSVLSQWAVRKEIAAGTLKQIHFPEVRLIRNFSMVYNRNGTLSHSFERFIEFLKAYPYSDLLAGSIQCNLCP